MIFLLKPYLYTSSLYENPSFIIFSAETENISTRSWYRNINKRKLSCYNLSFYNIDNKNGQCFLWNETQGGRSSCEVGTCLYLYISSIAGDVSPVKEITFYSDTCEGQNRNKFVVAALHYTLMNIPSVGIANHKFFESGHSQMKSDSMKVGTNEERVS